MAGGDGGYSTVMLQAVGAQVGGARPEGRDEVREAGGGGVAEGRSTKTVSVCLDVPGR